MVRVVIVHLISPDVAGTDARVIHSQLFSGSSRTKQHFMWQSDMVGEVHYVRDSLLVLLADGEGGE